MASDRVVDDRLVTSKNARLARRVYDYAMPDDLPTPPPLLSLLRFRTIDPVADARLAVGHHVGACVASFGSDAGYQGDAAYLRWLRTRVDEYPDGHVLAFLKSDGACVGQLELQVPYGLAVGYVNLFSVTERFRGRGFGRALHEYAQRYFRSWEANRIDLHVSPRNESAVGFYRRMGYKLSRVEPRRPGSMWMMSKALASPMYSAKRATGGVMRDE